MVTQGFTNTGVRLSPDWMKRGGVACTVFSDKLWNTGLLPGRLGK